jgi:hypothetical protein
MAQENIAFSQSIVNLDGLAAATYTTLAAAVQNVNPVVYNTAGEGAAGTMKQVTDKVTIVSGDNTSSTYSFVRIPTNAHVKKVLYRAVSVAGAGAADFNVRFSDSQTDGTPQALQGTIPQISSANNKLFGAAQSLLATSSGAGSLDLTYANITNFPYGSENQPLWEVLGFTTDPGGAFDIVAYVTTGVTTGGTALLVVDYTVPGSS